MLSGQTKQKDDNNNQPSNENKSEHFQLQAFFLPEEVSINAQTASTHTNFLAVNDLTLADVSLPFFHPPCNC